MEDEKLKLKLVSETEKQLREAAANVSGVMQSQSVLPGSAPSRFVERDASVSSDELTPWKKRRKTYKFSVKKLVLPAIFLVVCVPLAAVTCVFTSVPQGQGLLMLRGGLMSGNRDMILRGFESGWHNDPRFVGPILIPVANARAATDRLAAIDLYNDCVKLNPQLPNAYMNRGVNYTFLNRNDLAMADYNKAIALNPKYALAYSNRGWLNRNVKNYAKALADANRAIELAPKDPRFYYNRGITYAAMKKHKEALNDFLESDKLGLDEPKLQEWIDYEKYQIRPTDG